MFEHQRQVAVLVGHQPPVTAVVYDSEPNPELATDSGFSILLSDAPADGDEVTDGQLSTVCVHCLIEQHPEAGRGLDLAREHGSAERDLVTGEWTAS